MRFAERNSSRQIESLRCEIEALVVSATDVSGDGSGAAEGSKKVHGERTIYTVHPQITVRSGGSQFSDNALLSDDPVP